MTVRLKKNRFRSLFVTRWLPVNHSILLFSPPPHTFVQVLKCELETYKLRVKSLQEENRAIRQASVHIVSIYLHI